MLSTSVSAIVTLV